MNDGILTDDDMNVATGLDELAETIKKSIFRVYIISRKVLALLVIVNITLIGVGWFNLLDSFVVYSLSSVIFVVVIIVANYVSFYYAALEEDRKSVTRRLLFSSLGLIASESVYVVYYFLNQPSIILLIIAGNMILYLLFGVANFYQLKDTSVWCISLIIIIIVGVSFVIAPGAALWSGLVIEIIGAFIGVVGAIVLGELLKAYQKSRASLVLIQELYSELQDAAKWLNMGHREPAAIPLWTSVMMGGSLSTIDISIRKGLIVAYRAVEIYNIRRTQNECNTAIAAILIVLTAIKLELEGWLGLFSEISKAKQKETSTN